jgi:uncharacterized phage-associated protein
MNVEYDERKLTELILYVAKRLETDRAGGATKLNKVLYFADFANVRRTGRPLTGAEYQKLPQGPAPRRLLPIRTVLVERGEADIHRETFLGYEQHRLVAKREPDLSVFEPGELESVDLLLDDLAHLTAKQVSDLSHAEPGWRLVEEGQTIPYEAALIAPEQIHTPTAQRLAVEIAERYGVSAEV